tara:strand:- start:60681 stop:61220 length:540 start_codon:yes stop_codon:yes gene_type:complete
MGIYLDKFKINIKLLDDKFLTNPRRYIFQIGICIPIFILLLLLGDIVLRAPIVIAIASSAFTIFIIPRSISSSIRRVVGGHLVAIIMGGIFILLLTLTGFNELYKENTLFRDIWISILVVLSFFIMVITDTEHPPAAGTILGICLQDEWSWFAVLFILVSMLIMLSIKSILLKKLINLV